MKLKKREIAIPSHHARVKDIVRYRGRNWTVTLVNMEFAVLKLVKGEKPFNNYNKDIKSHKEVKVFIDKLKIVKRHGEEIII